MLWRVVLIIGALLIAFPAGYMVLTYGTLDPCEAVRQDLAALQARRDVHGFAYGIMQYSSFPAEDIRPSLLSCASYLMVLPKVIERGPVSRSLQISGSSGPPQLRHRGRAPRSALADLCTRLRADATGAWACSRLEWKPWVVNLYRQTADSPERMEDESGTPEAGTHMIELPDGSIRVLFRGCQSLDCPRASLYTLIEAKGRKMDIIWRTGTQVWYMGPTADLLSRFQTFEWLDQFDREFPPAMID